MSLRQILITGAIAVATVAVVSRIPMLRALVMGGNAAS